MRQYGQQKFMYLVQFFNQIHQLLLTKFLFLKRKEGSIILFYFILKILHIKVPLQKIKQRDYN